MFDYYEFDSEDTGDYDSFCCLGHEYGICEGCFEDLNLCECFDD